MKKNHIIGRLKATLTGLCAVAGVTMLSALPAHAIKINESWDLGGKFFADFTLAETDPDSGFHSKRNYLMLKGKLDSNTKFRLTLDQRVEDDRVFVKHAYVDRNIGGGLHVQAGLVSTPYAPWDEKNGWGYRFVEKSFTDYWKLLPTADMGASLVGNVGQGSNGFVYHVSLLNGEGYQHATDGEGFALAGRIGFEVDNIKLGGFAHQESDRDGTLGYDPFRVGGYIVAEMPGVRIGGQYVRMDDGLAGEPYDNDDGFNVQGRFKLPVGTDTWLFARYDTIDITTPVTGNAPTPNGSSNYGVGTNDLLIVGVAFPVGTGVTVAPNIKRFDTDAATGTEQVIGVHAQVLF